MAGFCAPLLPPSFFFFFFFFSFLLSVEGGQKHFKGSYENGDPEIFGGGDHQHSFGYFQGQPIYGTNATFSLWDPYVELDNEFSLAQLWLLYGENNTLEAGWQVYPGMYGDANPRLFVYWTKDNYSSTGCYNLDCTGFVQTSQIYVPGTTVLSPVSTVDGSQYEINLSVFQDSGTGDWFLYVNDEQVGYWPQGLSALTLNYATAVQWGGEIVNGAQNSQHTTTQMGSGEFAEAGYQEAAYIRNLQWVDAQNTLQNVELSNLNTQAEDPTCYNIVANNNTNWGTFFFFGGPGRNPQCP